MSSSLPSMSSTMLRMAGSTEVRDQQNPLSTTVHSTEGDEAPLAGLDVNTAISLALSRAGLSHKQACAYMDLDPSLWSRQLQGKDNAHVSFQRLRLLPRSFWREFLPLLGDPMQMTVTHQDIADLTMLRIVDLVESIGKVFVQSRAMRRAG
jgi:hypothetical protein